jgi:hypothetical protein
MVLLATDGVDGRREDEEGKRAAGFYYSLADLTRPFCQSPSSPISLGRAVMFRVA